jgi:hypothetical protein
VLDYILRSSRFAAVLAIIVEDDSVMIVNIRNDSQLTNSIVVPKFTVATILTIDI